MPNLEERKTAAMEKIANSFAMAAKELHQLNRNCAETNRILRKLREEDGGPVDVAVPPAVGDLASPE